MSRVRPRRPPHGSAMSSSPGIANGSHRRSNWICTGSDRGIEPEPRLFTASQALEIRGVVTVHGDDQIIEGEVVGMDLSTDVTDVVAAAGRPHATPSGEAGRRRVRGPSTRSRKRRAQFHAGWRRAEPRLGRMASGSDCPGTRTAREVVGTYGSPIQSVGVKRRNRRLLLTTNTLENAIAALATIGESSHAIANGMAATL